MKKATIFRWGCAAIAVLLLVGETLIAGAPYLLMWGTIHWMSDHIADYSLIAADQASDRTREFIQSNVVGSRLAPQNAHGWDWQFVPSVDSQSPVDWLAAGAPYLLLDNRTFLDEDFDTRLHKLVERGAILLYESPDILRLEPRQAVLWAFRPDHLLNVTFADDLQLIGYTSAEESDGMKVILYWNALRAPTAAYHLYIHLVDPVAGETPLLPDTEPDGFTHPTSDWRKGQLVFETILLPKDALAHAQSASRLRIGLYQLPEGNRAPIADEQRHDLGDHLDLAIF